MSSQVTAQIHIDTSSFPSDKSLPGTPIPLDGASASQLAPSTELHIRINPASAKPAQLNELANTIDATRASLNQILTSWKDWAGKEGIADPKSGANEDDDNVEEDEQEDEEE